MDIRSPVPYTDRTPYIHVSWFPGGQTAVDKLSGKVLYEDVAQSSYPPRRALRTSQPQHKTCIGITVPHMYIRKNKIRFHSPCRAEQRQAAERQGRHPTPRLTASASIEVVAAPSHHRHLARKLAEYVVRVGYLGVRCAPSVAVEGNRTGVFYPRVGL